MTLNDFKEFLIELNASEEFGFDGQINIGGINEDKEKAIFVRPLNKGNISDKLWIGQLRTYKVLPVSLLLHVSKDFNTTEIMSNKLFDYFLNNMYINQITKIKDFNIFHINLLSENVDLGRDSHDIFERVIELEIYYN